MIQFSIEPQGDQSVLVRLDGEDIDRLSRRIHVFCRRITESKWTGIIETVPAYVSAAIHYDPTLISFADVSAKVTDLWEEKRDVESLIGREFEFPVCYASPYSPDLEHVAEVHGMTPDDVIRLHQSAIYTVAMIGFTPGFPYLLGLPEALATPRLNQPRQVVASGSVGIGGNQAGIYSLESPGGWNIIGRTPARLFRPSCATPSLLMAGDSVKFVAVDEQEYRRIYADIDNVSFIKTSNN